ncbi:hypothetical protein [Subtercola frigoramans]|uniref:SMC interacting uncharacterized protein involved in chromosome segregation n=1 Tax=Subtercola frigoramans TaxID=120298 RepID=A0ABS2L934_9MICO|nr:hypothetical protein [Subtercola frigoramans]MBM7473391.1 SMC interacting uncharacterized protein involved in chromosome segregation [Subtercola frigoramans]
MTENTIAEPQSASTIDAHIPDPHSSAALTSGIETAAGSPTERTQVLPKSHLTDRNRRQFVRARRRRILTIAILIVVAAAAVALAAVALMHSR